MILWSETTFTLMRTFKIIFMLTWGKKVISIKEDGDDGIDDPLPREWSSETNTIDGPMAL